MPTRRTTMRSKSGTKLYAVRDESGKFKDIQTYKRAHAADLRHKSAAEKEAEQGGTFIIGVRGRIFIVESDYQVIEPAARFAAVGSGAPYALGSLATSKGSPVARVRQALAVAERFCAGVRAPFHVLIAPS